MVEFTVPCVSAVVKKLEPSRITAPSEGNLWTAVETMERLEALLVRLPASERREALVGAALRRGDSLWVPTARNCRMSVGVAVDSDGHCTFAVGEEGLNAPIANYFSARTAVARALYGQRDKNTSSVTNAAVETSGVGLDASLVEYIKASGWAMPVARRTSDLSPEILARFARLSERGIAHLFSEDGGVVLAMAGSTVGDRMDAVARLPILPAIPVAAKRKSGVLLSASEPETHYSEKAGWGLSVGPAKATLDTELRGAAIRFRASRRGSLAVADTGAERRRIESNRRRLRAEFVARRRSGEALVVRSAWEIDALREKGTCVHWTEEPEFRRLIESRRCAGRAAYDTARAVYLQRLPTVAHKLLHLLRRRGKPMDEAEFLSRHRRLCDTESPLPEADLRSALRNLAEAGKVRRLRSRESGTIFVAATRALDRRRFQRDLDLIISGPVSGISDTRTASVSVEFGADEALPGCDDETSLVEETGYEVLLDRSAEEELEAVAG